jgi:AraC-like DNA-binding protein
MNFTDLFSLFGVLVGFALSVVVWHAHRRDRPTRFLALFIVTIAARAVPALTYRLPWVEDKFTALFLPLHFFYLSLPLLYLYTLRMTGRFRWRRDTLHLVPGALELLFCLALIALKWWAGRAPLSAASTQQLMGGYTALALVPGIVYTVLIIRTLNRHQQYLLNYYSNLEGRHLNWIAYALYFNVAISIIYVFLGYGPLPESRDAGVIFGAIGNTVLVCYISYRGIRQLRLRRGPKTTSVRRDVAKPSRESNSHSELFRDLDSYVRENECYLDPNLSIGDLAKHLGRGERTLSRVINSETADHFNGYINGYRIAVAKKLLSDPNYDHYTMEAIAAEAGFNSKATFYKSFRLHSEVSPAQFRRQRSVA